MLQMRPNCEWCDKDLAPDSSSALICSFECTFCAECAAHPFHGICPNCGGELVKRPRRSVALCEKYPASTLRVHARRTDAC